MERILRYSMAALVMALFVGCSHDMEYSQPSKEQVQKNVAEKLGIEIDPNQNWNASTAITANVSVNLGLDQEYTLVIYDKNPLFEDDVFYYAKTVVKEGDTATLKLDVPSADSVFYAAVFDSKFRRLVQSAYREDSVLTMNFGTAASESRSNRAAENASIYPDFVRTVADYLNPNVQYKTTKTISLDAMKNYPAITNQIIANETSNGNHTLSDQSSYYNPAAYPAHGDGKHYRVASGTEITEVFNINGTYGVVNDAVIYIEGKVHLNGNTLNGVTLVVASGGELILDGATSMSNAGRFVILPGGKFTGTQNVSFLVANGAACYNGGTIDLKGELNVNGSDFYNSGTMKVDNLNNQSGGKITNFGSIVARTNNGESNTYNCTIINGCYMHFTENAGVGTLTMLDNSRLDVDGMASIAGGVYYGQGAILYDKSEINAGRIYLNGTKFTGPTASGTYAVVKSGGMLISQGGDLEAVGNIYFDWNIANFYNHQGQQDYNSTVDNGYTPLSLVKRKNLNFVNEANAPFTIPRGDCTGNGYHDTSEVPTQTIPGEPAVWTYAFEDTPLGDYDMNDVVIKVSENAEDATRLDITLCCTGAANNLTVYLDDMVLFAGSGKEVHQVFGQAAGKFINTVNDGIKVDPITETIRKPANFSFETADFWIKSPSGDVHVAKQGEDPHGIVVPGNWRWPREFQCIKDAYPNFIEFAKDASTTDDNIKKWYETSNGNPVEEYIYTPAN
ncbi:DUF4842 domain-containing protein [uncultured Prevotella sp.]|uniref:DUF4842 domain-containing protein n=1 Tax=uncultured Prevotella sp. TaxID=159272 RepID=UPI00258CC6B3|nr:DUF4842 domain-containing protein [uncultured Prevotella sp.]